MIKDWNRILRNFFESSLESTDFGTCCLITPYLNFENPETKNIPAGSYEGYHYHAIPTGIRNNRQGLR